MKTIWIVYNGTLSGGSFLQQRKSYARAAEKAGLHVREVTAEESVYIDEKPLFAIFADKDIYAAMSLENKGIRLFNSSECIRICDDKALTYIKLTAAGVPIPDTVIPPKIYGGSVNNAFCISAAAKLGYPLIIKECFGSFGKQVYLAENETEMLEIKNKIGSAPFVFQRFVAKSAGTDIRVIVSGGRVIGAVKRYNTNDFRSKVENGGAVMHCAPSRFRDKLALAAANACGAAFAGVDLIEDDTGFKVCEVNSNFHFGGAQPFVECDIADEIINDIIFYSLNK